MGWLFAAYTVVWAGFFFYVSHLQKKQRAISEEIADLKKQIGADRAA